MVSSKENKFEFMIDNVCSCCCYVLIAADWTYTFKSKNKSETQISELCSVISPRLLHKYANRTVYETHLAILSNIESAMLLSLSTSEHVGDTHDTHM